jgi:hypothetical protein
MKPGEIHIDPVWVLRPVAKKCRIPDYMSIYRVLKGIRKSRRVKSLVGMGRKIYSEITAWFG